MKSNRQQLGLTLIELMMVASIIVVLMVVLMTYVFPSEDRQCRLEAERLASYLTRISAEALTSGSPARAVVDIPKSFVFRESTRETADFTQQLWQVGNRKLEHTVKEPVFVDSVDTESVADQKSGRAFVIFAGSKTEGAVIVLAAGQAFYSVVVPPGNGEIRVEEGRSKAGRGLQRQKPSLPSMTGYSSTPTKSDFPVVGMPPSVPVVPRARPTNRNAPRARKAGKKSKKNDARSFDRGNAPDIDSAPPTSKSQSSSSFGGGNSSTAGTNVTNSTPTGSTTPQTPTNNNQNCPNGNCMPPPDGRTFRLNNATVVEPEGLKPLLEPILNDLIAAGKLTLLARLNRPSSWLIQATRKGDHYGNSEQFPSYRGEPYPILCSAAHCSTVWTPDTDDAHSLTLFIRNPDIDAESNECLYQPLDLVDVEVSIEVSLDSSAMIDVRGVIRQSSAKAYTISGQGSLYDVLEDNGVPKNADSVGDGLEDSWAFSFFGYANQVSFIDNPAANTEQRPNNCDESESEL